MITLNHKQAEDALYLSGMAGGKEVTIWRTLHGKGIGRPAIYAQVGDSVWWLRPKAKLQKVR